MRLLPLVTLTVMSAAGCATAPAGSFGDDLAFLRKHTQVIVLEQGSARVAVCPALQGRVMTSTTGGPGGPSFGWINRSLLASRRHQPHINAYGGEDRFWLGPEGGQFGLFFAPGAAFDLAHWQTPAPLDSEPFALVQQSSGQVRFRKRMRVNNRAGTAFDLELDRQVRLLGAEEAWSLLGLSAVAGVATVAFQSDNRITNSGAAPWREDSGLVSVWILGMFNPSPRTVVIVPFEPGDEAERGPIVNDAYFGKVPPDRLEIGQGALHFRGDGALRSKIGLTRRRARPVLGSWDPDARLLTIVQYTLPAEGERYVNSMWQVQDQPYDGDVVNSYNDGPPGPGLPPLGPFYELETSSPAAALHPGAALSHVHRTFHFHGPTAALDGIARQVLGVALTPERTGQKR